MRVKMIFALVAVYAVAAAPAFLPGGWRVIVQPATEDAVEVYYQPVSPERFRSYEGIRPFQRALEAAERRVEAHPYDLAPPYILHGPYRLIAPYVTERGRELASPLISGMDWPEGVATPYAVVPQVRPVVNSQAELRALVLMRGWVFHEPAVLGMGIEPELNRVVISTNAFDQGLRHRLAREYGSRLVVVEWDPLARPMRLL
ncbi:hypothetical protein AB0C27_07055 [Nonomuraea sp. NPDC048882]|uniref:hypothetical protein n=1 Tax=Nonomuraea sp. NPDC048882 TaxID=3154347 RepID=UPI000ACF03FA